MCRRTGLKDDFLNGFQPFFFLGSSAYPLASCSRPRLIRSANWTFSFAATAQTRGHNRCNVEHTDCEFASGNAGNARAVFHHRSGSRFLGRRLARRGRSVGRGGNCIPSWCPLSWESFGWSLRSSVATRAQVEVWLTGPGKSRSGCGQGCNSADRTCCCPGSRRENAVGTGIY
jgi:hypothetical protein